MGRRLIAAGCLAVALALAAPAIAAAPTPHTLTAASGAVSATLTYDEGTKYGLPQDTNLRLSITRAGVQAYAGPGPSASCGAADTQCVVAGDQANPALAVQDIESDGEPDVILDLYTGGAHCCFVTQVFAWDPTSTSYLETERNFGDPGSVIEDLAGNGRFEFVSADDRFAYEFAAFVYSGLPIQIWRFAGHRFVDVTRSFPARIRRDAKREYKDFVENARAGLGLGFIAAWAADEDLLGHEAQVARTLAVQLREGHLRSGGGIGPGGKTFIAKLQRFLAHEGYRS